VIVFNEIHYHPSNEDNDPEWVELHSLMGVDVDISGWELEGGINYLFANGTVVPGHGYLLVASDPTHPSLAGRGVRGPFTGRLANNGETIRLVNNNGRTMDQLGYGDDGDWPVGADGMGSTLSKRNEKTAESRPFNWIASPGRGGTPGLPNFPGNAGNAIVQDIVFSEISGGDSPGFQIELTNTGSENIDLTGWQLRSSTGANQQIPAGLLEPGEYLALTPTFPVATGHRLALFRSESGTLADARKVTGRLRGLLDDRWLYPDAPTFGSPNSYSINTDIVINEIMYNPRPLPATRPSSPDLLVDWNHLWRYNESGNDLGGQWKDQPHLADGVTWFSGPGPLGAGNSSLSHPISTILSPLGSRDPRTVTFYFETDFELSEQQKKDTTRLELTHQIDDGAIFYLNGTEVHRYQVDEGPVTSSSTANTTVEDAETVTLILPSFSLSALREGSNRLSVEVHQDCN
jgi:hypothetical protein